MNSNIKNSILAMLVLACSPALACDYPNRPHIPDGSTVTKDELLAAKSAVQTYLASVDDYLLCVEAETEAANDKSSEEDSEMAKKRSKLLDQKFEAANQEKELVGEQFNRQIRAYNEQRKNSSE